MSKPDAAPLISDAIKARGMVTGSRGWRDRQTLEATLSSYFGSDIVLMHGGAVGADVMADRWALRHGVPVQTFLPNRGRPSPQRYHERNDAMLEQADFVVAFWDGESRGTKSVIDKALARYIPVVQVREAS